LGNGDGTFQTPASYSSGFYPEHLAIGDFNGDGKTDLAVADYYSGVSVLLGNGDGTFQPPVSYAAGPGPTFVAVGDFDGNGTLDLVVANDSFGFTMLAVLLGNGDGTFQPAVDYSAAVAISGLVLADFNGDGKIDIAAAGLGDG